MKKGYKQIMMPIVAFVLTVCLAVGLLVFSAFLPQSPILENVRESMDQLYGEGFYPRTSDYRDASILDNATDIQMLRASVSTNDQYLGSILTNPLYEYGELNILECLDNQVNGFAHDNVNYYVRYWMGFRVFLRVLLVFLDYFQIRRYLAFAFFALLIAVTCSISKHINTKLAFLFALSIILVRPQVIADSLQFSCCFLIAFLAMLLIPWLKRNPRWETIFFLEIGMITMYIDFYTVPLVTVGFPLVYLCALRAVDGENVSIKRILKDLLSWLLGYGLMWLAKLGLTSMFTSIDAIENGLTSFFGRVGIVKNTELEEYYSVSRAFECIKKVIYSDIEGKYIYLLGAATVVAVVCVKTVKDRIPLRAFCANWQFLFIAILPFIWFAVTAQPIAIHSYFQYRSIALVHWAVGAYFCMVLEKRQLNPLE